MFYLETNQIVNRLLFVFTCNQRLSKSIGKTNKDKLLLHNIYISVSPPLKPFQIFLPLPLWASLKALNGHSRTSTTFPGHPAHLLTILVDGSNIQLVKQSYAIGDSGLYIAGHIGRERGHPDIHGWWWLCNKEKSIPMKWMNQLKHCFRTALYLLGSDMRHCKLAHQSQSQYCATFPSHVWSILWII